MKAKTMKQVWGLLRVLGLATLILSVTGVVAVRRAEAHFTEVLRGFGEQLAALHELSTHSAPRKLFVNGLELRVLSASTPLPVTDALDRFQSLCHGVRDLDVPASLKQNLEKAGSLGPLNESGVIREQTEHEGFVACIDTGTRIDGAAFVRRLEEFGRTKDLKSFGEMRYALARSRGGQTTLIMFWTEGEAKLADLFKKGQDAPGRDLRDVPRPAGSTRVLSAFEQGAASGLAFYRVEGQALSTVSAAYEGALRNGGWRLSKGKNGTVTASKGERGLFVRMKARGDGRVNVGILDLG